MGLSRRIAARDAVSLGPNIDFALATMCRALSLTEAGPFAVFATGRSAGWLAHAQEHASPKLIRPRARYVGDEPQSGTPLTAADASSRVGDRAP